MATKHKDGCNWKHVDLSCYERFSYVLIDEYGITYGDSLHNEETDLKFKFCPMCGVEIND